MTTITDKQLIQLLKLEAQQNRKIETYPNSDSLRETIGLDWAIYDIVLDILGMPEDTSANPPDDSPDYFCRDGWLDYLLELQEEEQPDQAYQEFLDEVRAALSPDNT